MSEWNFGKTLSCCVQQNWLALV